MTRMPEIRSHAYLGVLVLLGCLIYAPPLGALWRIALHNDTHSHILLIPLISLALVALQRSTILAETRGAPKTGFGI